MKLKLKSNELVIDLDEARYIAKQSIPWSSGLEGKRIELAKLALEVAQLAQASSPGAAWDKRDVIF